MIILLRLAWYLGLNLIGTKHPIHEIHAGPIADVIEKYILNQSEAKKPNICFIPTATGDNEGYKENFYSTFSTLDCEPTHLDFFKRTPNLENLIKEQDIIFVGGGIPFL